MKRMLCTLTVSVVHALAQPAAAATVSGGEIDSRYRNLVRAIDRKDLDAIMSSYANDGSLFVFDVVRRASTSGALRSAKVSLGAFHVTMSGDVAYDRYVLNDDRHPCDGRAAQARRFVYDTGKADPMSRP